MLHPFITMKASPESSEHLEVDGLKDMLRGVQLNEQHDEDPVVGHLLEFRLPHFMVLKEHSCYNSKNLQRKGEEFKENSWHV